MKVEPLIFILIVFPFLAAACCYLIRSKMVRSIIIMATACLLVSSAVLLIPYVPFSLSPETFFGVGVHDIISISDFLLLIIILYYGFKHHNLVIKGLAFSKVNEFLEIANIGPFDVVYSRFDQDIRVQKIKIEWRLTWKRT